VIVPAADGDRDAHQAALSFLSIGGQPPAPVGDDNPGRGAIVHPAVALAPGLAIALTVLALNVLGDGIRDALDPRAKVRRVP
jgi:peptide/nickel transport system permease protein